MLTQIRVLYYILNALDTVLSYFSSICSTLSVWMLTALIHSTSLHFIRATVRMVLCQPSTIYHFSLCRNVWHRSVAFEDACDCLFMHTREPQIVCTDFKTSHAKINCFNFIFSMNFLKCPQVVRGIV